MTPSPSSASRSAADTAAAHAPSNPSTQSAPQPRELVRSVVIAASAGTGKTYQLSLRFIALMALGVPPLQMIALTFTRKAAGEFLDRILRRLAEGAASEEGAARLAADIRRCWQGNAAEGVPALCPGADEARHPLTRARFRELLLLFIERFSEQHLTTIDSFFNRLVGLSGLELGLRGSVDMISDAKLERARTEAIRDLMAFVSLSREGEKLGEQLQDILGSGGTPLTDSLRKLVNDFGQLYNHAQRAELWKSWKNAFRIPDYRHLPELCDADIDAACAEVEELAARSRDDAKLIEKATKICLKYLESLREGELPKSDPGCGKPKITEHTPDTRRMCDIALRMKREFLKRVLGRAQRKGLALYQLLGLYNELYTKRAISLGQLSFNDNATLARRALAEGGSDVPTRLAFRLDGELTHWLLDEFQDTSHEQWQVLSLLLDEIIAETGSNSEHLAERSLFIVGDIKQGIYSWRGAYDRIFKNLLSPGAPLTRMNMNKSYRSSQVVLDFVNRVFDFSGPDEKHVSARKLSGYVCVSRFGEESTGKKKVPRGDAADAIAAILRDLPFKEREMSVCILLNTNDDIRDLSARLRRLCPDLPIRAVNKIQVTTDSPVGQTLLSFFRWLQHPRNPHHVAIVKNSPLAPALDGAEGSWQSWRRRLEQAGYAAVMERLRRCLEEARCDGRPVLNDFMRHRLNIWVSQAYTFDLSGGTLDDWIDTMSTLGLNENPPKSCIHLMTVNTSKGLEYDVVILPMLEVQKHANKVSYLCRTDAQGDIAGIFTPVGEKKINDHVDELRGDYAANESEAEEQESHKLYVALTRAARANYILIPRMAKPGMKYNGSRILDAIGADGSDDDYEEGDPHWYDELPPRAEEEKAAAAPPQLGAASPRRRRCSPSESCTDEEEMLAAGGGDAEAGDAEAGEAGDRVGTASTSPSGAAPRRFGLPSPERRAEAMAFGTEVHALLETIEWLDEDNPPAWYTSPKTPAEKLASRALHDDALRRFFVRSDGAEACNEQPLEAVSDREWTSAVIDRLLLYPNERRAEILDYKTTRRRCDLGTHYLPQMQAYRRLVARATGFDEAHIGVTLVQLSLEGDLQLHRYSEEELR